MSINSLLLNKQIELFVKDFFVEKLLTADKLDDDSYIDLRNYLNQRLTELKKTQVLISLLMNIETHFLNSVQI